MGVENVFIGPCTVTFGAADLGYTQGVTVEIDVTASPTNEIGLPVHYDYYVESMSVRATLNLAETHSAQLSTVFPWGSSGALTDGSGTKLRELAQPLVLTPLDTAADAITLPMAVPIASAKLDYSNNGIRLISVTFQALTVSETDVTLMTFAPQVVTP